MSCAQMCHIRPAVQSKTDDVLILTSCKLINKFHLTINTLILQPSLVFVLHRRQIFMLPLKQTSMLTPVLNLYERSYILRWFLYTAFRINTSESGLERQLNMQECSGLKDHKSNRFTSEVADVR